MLLVKIGGGAGINWDGVCLDILDLLSKEAVICVHGANVQRDELAARLSVPVQTVFSPSGISSVYTDRALMEVLLMAYAGLVNKKIVARMQSHGINAVGLSGVDGRLWEASPKKNLLVKERGKVKLLKGNLTGRVESINSSLLMLLMDNGYCPVVCAPALSFENEIVNTDNDWAAAVMAGALGIKKIVSLFEAPGLLRDAGDENTMISRIRKEDLDGVLKHAKGRMKKKILGAKKSFENGVEALFWGDGRIDRPVLKTLQGKGTVIR